MTEPVVEQDGYRVHYAALPTTQIAPAAARAYGVRPARNRGLVLVNVQRAAAGGTRSVPALASGAARSLSGHVERLAFRGVRDGDAWDAIAEFQFLDQEWITFDVEVTPEGAARPLRVRFQQQFYSD
jgi:hypothetical protein